MDYNLSHTYPTPLINISSMEDEVLPSVTVHEYTHQAGVRIALLWGKIFVLENKSCQEVVSIIINIWYLIQTELCI